MKQIMSLALVCLLAFTGCKKETFNANSDKLALSDFTDTRALEAGVAYKNEIGPSNLKAIIRKVDGSDNMYRLILKVDSVYTEVGKDANGVPQFAMIAFDDFEVSPKVTSGLSIPDPLNADKEFIYFKDGEMQFTKEQENGFYVYKSQPFASATDFDYELVTIQYTIIHTIQDSYAGGHITRTTSGSHRCFILPNGKAIEQNPEIEKVNKQGKWIHISGKEFAKTMVVTIANDPAQEIEKLVFQPDVVKIATGNPAEPVKYIELPTVVLEKTLFNQNSGVARFSSSNLEETYGDGKSPKEWTGSGMIYLVNPRVGTWIQAKADELAKK
jgi:hypothetical protein